MSPAHSINVFWILGLGLCLIYLVSLGKLLLGVARALPQQYENPKVSDYFRSLLKSETLTDICNGFCILVLAVLLMAYGLEKVSPSFQWKTWWENQWSSDEHVDS